MSFTVSPDRAHAANIESSSLFLKPGETVTVTWSPSFVAPGVFSDHIRNLRVDVSIYRQEYPRDRSISNPTWKRVQTLASNVPNTGSVLVTVPSRAIRCNYPRFLRLPINICPIAIKVSISKQPSNSPIPPSVGIWTGIGYLPSIFSSGTSLRQNCEAWFNIETRIGAGPSFRILPPCPSTQTLINFDSRYEREILSSIITETKFEKDFMDFFHPNIETCYRQIT